MSSTSKVLLPDGSIIKSFAQQIKQLKVAKFLGNCLFTFTQKVNEVFWLKC